MKSNTDIAARILYEDNHLIVVNKLAGELVQGDKSGDLPLVEIVKGHIKVTNNKPGNVFLGIPHRLDRPVSGVVIFAKTSKALSRMSEIFRAKTIEKTYWAISDQAPKAPAGSLTDHLLKNEKQNKSYCVDAKRKGAKEAKLRFKHSQSSDRFHLIEVQLETGRHHQIRVQLAQMGCIIKGDLKYGAKRSNPDASISLHSRSARFFHPVKNEELEIIAPCPDDTLWKFFEDSAA